MLGRAMGGVGLGLAVLSAAAFATSGSLAASLLQAGWTPGAAVTVRVALAALVLTPPALLAARRQGVALRRGTGTFVLYGVTAVAGTQLCFFLAIQYLSVAVALLLEYSGVLLVVVWTWLRHHQRPGRLTVLGAVAAIGGLLLVLDVAGASAPVAPVGVAWGLAAAVGLATYFVISAEVDPDLPPLTVAWGGLLVGAVVLGGAGLLGVLPMAAPATDVRLLAAEVSWVVPVLGLSLVAGAVAYVAGIAGARRLGARVASFVGLSEVVFAVVFAWVLVDQPLTPIQLVGGALVVAGIALVRLEALRAARVVIARSPPRPPAVS